jgi:hypothetical protein
MRNQKSRLSLLENSDLSIADRRSIEICGFIYGPQNILPLLSAIQELFIDFNELAIEIFYIFEDSKSNLENQSSFQTARQMIDFTDARLTAISKFDFVGFSNTYLTKGLGTSKKYSQKMLFFPHSYDQESSELFENLGEDRVNICYGDGFGLAINSDFQRNLTFKENLSNISLLRKLYRWMKNIFILSKFSDFLPDFFVLIIGISQDGRLLKSDNFITCQKSEVVSLINKIQKSCGIKSNSYLKNVSCLLLLERFHESGVLSYEEELNLYIAILEKNSHLGGQIVLKNHPLANSRMLDDIKASLPELEFVEVPEAISNLPIEIWGLEETDLNVISFGNATYSLKYLYQIDTRAPFENSYSLLPSELQEKPYVADVFSLIDSTLRVMELDFGGPIVNSRRISFLDEVTIKLVAWTRILRRSK